MVIFNTVMNTLVDTITDRIDIGYEFSGSSRKVNIVWSTVVQSLPEEQMKFSLNAAVDELCTTMQICTCGRRGTILPAHSVTTTNPSCMC